MDVASPPNTLPRSTIQWAFLTDEEVAVLVSSLERAWDIWRKREDAERTNLFLLKAEALMGEAEQEYKRRALSHVRFFKGGE